MLRARWPIVVIALDRRIFATQASECDSHSMVWLRTPPDATGVE